MTTRILSVAALFAAVLALAACGPGNNAPAGGGNDGGGNSAPAGNDVADNDNDGDDDNDGDNNGADDFDVNAARDAQVEAAWEYLKGEYNKPPSQDDPQGLLSGWGRESMNIPYTGMILLGLHGTAVWNLEDEMIKDSVVWLIETQEPTGAWSYMPNIEHLKGVRAIYITSVLARLLSALNAEGPWKGKLDNELASAVDYLKTAQVGHPEGPAPDYDENTAGFGGWAYSKEEIPVSVDEKGKPAANISTSTFAIDALHACGVDKDDPLWEDAITFLKRNQNAGEVQSEGFTAMYKGEKKIKMAGEGSPDYGGAIYSEETTKAGVQENEDGTVTLFSYGSVTYNLLRSYLFAGLKKDSVPVKLAWGWVQRNYTVERVPGYRDEAKFDMGLYYYYMSMAKTLSAFGEDFVEEPDRGLKHNWRADIVRELGERQKDDGSWINDNHDRWQENSKVLCTAYSLLALKHTRK